MRSSAARTSGAPTTRTFGVFRSAAHISAASAPSSITRTPIGCMESHDRRAQATRLSGELQDLPELPLRALFQLVDRLVRAAHRLLADLIEQGAVFNRRSARAAADIALRAQRPRRERRELGGGAALAGSDDFAN